MKGFYQTAGLVGWVFWTWLLMIPVFGMIMWLEVSHLNVYAIGAFILFVVLVVYIFGRQRITVETDGLRFRKLASIHSDYITFDEMSQIQFSKRTMMFSVRGEQYNYWFSSNILTELKQRFSTLHK
ncbi:EbsA family protein [Weissella ceti]|uniref:EbsA family protein n=1 Tax=Weissella ceti TaxID=759620 RepID=UPI001BD10929|nr:EbsA family protein [Weissella ceti]QVK11701.1 pore-forming protein [Weissella ceti]